MTEILDILVVGGGVAGLSAATALQSEGWRVACVDAAPPSGGPADTRTTAVLKPGVDLLTAAGVWPRLDGDRAPLATMRLIDAGGRVNRPRETADFNAEEALGPGGVGVFGWNVPNMALRRALEGRLEECGAPVRRGMALSALTLRRDVAIACFANGETLRARLVVGADGRDSAVRRLVGIGARRWDYGQKALVFTTAHDAPHDGVSTEIHRTGGPFTLVPMPDGEDGRPRSSVVWMERAAEADRLAALDKAAFEAALNARALDVLGPLSLVSGRAAWPIISLLAHRMTAPRTALIAEAVHVSPPIGAQGLNMSLGDIASLIAAIGPAGDGAGGAAGEDPGRAAAMARHQRRWPELAARVAGVDILNRAAQAEAQPLRDLRRLGLGAIHRVAPVRRLAMRLGLGVGG